MGINQWPEAERPREKLRLQGAESLSDAELLAIFLRTGVNGCSAVDVARALLKRFGNLKSILEASCDQLCEVHGVGSSKYVQLQAAIELGQRYIKSGMQRQDALSHSAQTRDFLSLKMKSYPYEVFACLFLDNKNRVIEFKELFRGSISGASVHGREVVKESLACNAAAVIFAHNHPSGVAEPSHADIAVTEQLQKALDLVDVRVLDHIIVGEQECLSLAEQGLL